MLISPPQPAVVVNGFVQGEGTGQAAEMTNDEARMTKARLASPEPRGPSPQPRAPSRSAGLKPAAIQAVHESPLGESKSSSASAVKRAVVEQPTNKAAVRTVASTSPAQSVANVPAAAEEQLAPIVPAWAVPKPKARSQESGARGQESGAKAATSGRGAPPTEPSTTAAAPVRIELGVGGQTAGVGSRESEASTPPRTVDHGQRAAVSRLLPTVSKQPTAMPAAAPLALPPAKQTPSAGSKPAPGQARTDVASQSPGPGLVPAEEKQVAAPLALPGFQSAIDGQPAAAPAKQSFADVRSQAELGNEMNRASAPSHQPPATSHSSALNP